MSDFKNNVKSLLFSKVTRNHGNRVGRESIDEAIHATHWGGKVQKVVELQAHEALWSQKGGDAARAGNITRVPRKHLALRHEGGVSTVYIPADGYGGMHLWKNRGRLFVKHVKNSNDHRLIVGHERRQDGQESKR